MSTMGWWWKRQAAVLAVVAVSLCGGCGDDNDDATIVSELEPNDIEAQPVPEVEPSRDYRIRGEISSIPGGEDIDFFRPTISGASEFEFTLAVIIPQGMDIDAAVFDDEGNFIDGCFASVDTRLDTCRFVFTPDAEDVEGESIGFLIGVSGFQGATGPYTLILAAGRD